MNRLDGRVASSRGTETIRVAAVEGPWGRLAALVVGGTGSPWAPGAPVRALFKETAPTILPPDAGRGLEATVASRRDGEVLASLGLRLAGGAEVSVVLPHEEIPRGLAIDDRIRLHVPASAVALEAP